MGLIKTDTLGTKLRALLIKKWFFRMHNSNKAGSRIQTADKYNETQKPSKLDIHNILTRWTTIYCTRKITKPCRIDLRFLILLCQQAGCQHRLCEKSDHSYLLEVLEFLYKQKMQAHQQKRNLSLSEAMPKPETPNYHHQCSNDYTKVNKTKTMKQTKRAILEVSHAPRAPLLICSKDAPKL